MARLLIFLLLGLLTTSVGAVEEPLVDVLLGDASSRGPADAAVTMAEFIDCQYPYLSGCWYDRRKYYSGITW